MEENSADGWEGSRRGVGKLWEASRGLGRGCDELAEPIKAQASIVWPWGMHSTCGSGPSDLWWPTVAAGVTCDCHTTTAAAATCHVTRRCATTLEGR
jgi:hypothetical protein